LSLKIPQIIDTIGRGGSGRRCRCTEEGSHNIIYF